MRAVSFVLKLYSYQMYRDEFNQYELDFEAHHTRAAQLDGAYRGGYGAIEGSRTVCADRTHSAGWFGDGPGVVALSPAKKWGRVRPVADEIIGVFPIVESFAFWCSRMEGRWRLYRLEPAQRRCMCFAKYEQAIV